MAYDLLTLRPFRDSDAEAVREVLRNMVTAIYWPHLSPQAKAELTDADRIGAFVAQAGRGFMLAEWNGAVLGMIDWRESRVTAMAVHSRHQRHGIGGHLLAHAEGEMARAGLRTGQMWLETLNARGRAFASRHGYSESGRQPDGLWGSGFTTLVYTKTL